MDELMNALENLKQTMLTSLIIDDLDATGLWIKYLAVSDAAMKMKKESSLGNFEIKPREKPSEPL